MNKGIPIIRRFEGCRLRAYLCPANKWTIGWGSCFYENGSAVKEGDIITQERADKLLINTVIEFEQGVKNAVKSTINDNQLGALTSFAFNIGVRRFRGCTLLKMVNKNPDDILIRRELLKWVNKGSAFERGLTRRRTAEADLYFTPIIG